MNRCLLPAMLCLALVSGCSLDLASQYQSTIDAVIGTSATYGEAPLKVVFSGAESTSEGGVIVRYIWNFADLATIEGETAEYTFTSPGRFPVTLTVIDESGQQGMARVYVRIAGGSVTAVIGASTLSGPAPLVVHFDGTESTAEDDVILDYYWEFGDGDESRLAAPVHIYESAGTYVVHLRAISAGGVEGTAQATIEVGAGTGGASLQFNGTQYATLPVDASETLSAFTFEAWFNADDGGTLVNFGVPAVSIDVSPTGGTITLDAGSASYPVAAAVTSGDWQHVAVSYSEEDGATVYLDGTSIGSAALSGTFSTSLLTLGGGFDGKVARVRFWSVARSDTEVSADVSGSVTGYEEGLLGDWPLSEGSGQTLTNNASGGQDGTLGAGTSTETADPAWSTDSP